MTVSFAPHQQQAAAVASLAKRVKRHEAKRNRRFPERPPRRLPAPQGNRLALSSS